MGLTSIEQGTPEWFSARRGLATGSAFKKAMATARTGGKDSFGQTAMDYALELAGERMGGEDEAVETLPMARGTSLEGEALTLYEDTMFNTVRRKLFYVHDSLRCAASPDGMFDEDGKTGVVEVKCMKSSKHAGCWYEQVVPAEHVIQVQFNLWITGADFCDFVSYHPSVREDMRLCVIRMPRSSDLITDISMRAIKFMAKVDEVSRQLGSADWKAYHELHPEVLL